MRYFTQKQEKDTHSYMGMALFCAYSLYRVVKNTYLRVDEEVKVGQVSEMKKPSKREIEPISSTLSKIEFLPGIVKYLTYTRLLIDTPPCLHIYAFQPQGLNHLELLMIHPFG